MILESIDKLIQESNNNFLSYNTKEFLNYLNTEIKYGFIDKNNRIYKEKEVKEDNSNWVDNYTIQTKDRLSKTKIGHCWDFVELERFYFNKNNIKCKSYFIGDKDLNITHTFLIYFLDKKVYWIESAWFKLNGEYEFNSESECLNFVKSKFKQHNNYNSIILKEYSEPKSNTNQLEFMEQFK